MATTARKPDNLIPTKLLDEAKRLGVEIAGRSEEQLRDAVRSAWQKENREAIEASNAWVKKHGLPISKLR
jgi:antitoxin CcdA